MSSEVSFTKSGTAVSLVVDCHASMKLFDEKTFIDFFEKSDYYNHFLFRDYLNECLGELNGVIQDIKDKKIKPKQYSFVIAEQRNAKVTIKISRDKMSAKAEVTAPWGGKHGNIDLIKYECKDAGVIFGVKRSRVEKLLDRSFSGEPGDTFEEIIAIGKEAQNGKNAYFKPLVHLFSEKIRKPMELEDGKVDLRDLGNIETVKPGEKIYQKVPLTYGTDGKNVLGEVLEAQRGKDSRLEVTSGTVLDPDDPNVLLANREGLARIIEDRMEVDDVYTLVELTPKQGHIKFNGSVVVLGDVAPEMKIIASGDVLVGGFVESATIKCKGELTVLSGASGKPLEQVEGKRKNNCLLESGYRVNVAFANHVDIFAKRDLFIHKQISHCNVSAASMVVGRGPKPRGKIIGGSYYVSKSIETGVVGAPSDTNTNIIMNRTYDVFKDRELKFWQQIEHLQEQMEELTTRLASVHQKEKQAEIQVEVNKLNQVIEQNSAYRKTLANRRREYMAAVQVKVNNTLYGGLQFIFGSKGTVNEAEKGPSIVRLDEYTLLIEPLTRR